ncbi:MAG: hypothetical protein WAW96_14630, partial [Alphaproteobacteria bacterium]
MAWFERIIHVSDWPFVVKLGAAPAIAVLLMLVLLMSGNRGLATQSASAQKIIEVSVEGNGLLLEAELGVESINGGLYRLLTLQAAHSQG